VPTSKPDPAKRGAGLAAQFPFNANKAAEHGAGVPPAGAAASPGDPLDTASTASESATSDKAGAGVPPQGENPNNGPLDRVRTDAGGRPLSTNQGVPVADNQNSLKAGLRGPALLEDFILREKITHFDHERIPERVVHARGSAAHGFFECYHELSELTRAAPFAAAGKRTPVFVRFSTVAGERGSTDTARDVRGFAVKFYTDEGNWDLVGNNIPVFFIQDAMKFPDLVHALKPEPHNAMPQAASAHDTFWDFVSLMPESMHMLMWVMSDRAIPRSYRTMQGFGVHTFRLVNAAGQTRLVKFHWLPKQGTYSLVWDEAVRIAGADPDFHRRDLWEAIEMGEYPEWELALQVFTEEDAAQFPFDVLDPTKIVPEELVPLQTVGRLVLERNPDNFFAETEQVAFCAAHVVPGIDFSNDPLLAGRIHSYVDTQISRLGGPNFHEIPINAPLAQVHNNQRDGMHRQAIHRGRVAYEPNSLGGGCPFQTGRAGFMSFPEPVQEDKVRGKPELFADHYSQARLFWQSQSPAEQMHIAHAFSFELSKVQVPAIRARTLSMLVNVDAALADMVALRLGTLVPAPQPMASTRELASYQPSPGLSLLSRPGEVGVHGRKVAILIAAGCDEAMVAALQADLESRGAVTRLVGPRVGMVGGLEADMSLETGPAVLFDAVVVPDGDAAADTLASNALAVEFVTLQYRHCKPLMVVGAGATLLAAAGVPATLPGGVPDPGLVGTAPADLQAALAAFASALAGPRIFDRETDPPSV
jgi:catalase